MDSQKFAKGNSWLRTFSIGFGIISFGITLELVGYFLTSNKVQPPIEQQSGKMTNAPAEKNSDTLPLLIKHLGIDFDKDIVFTKEKLEFDAIFFDYGFVIPA